MSSLVWAWPYAEEREVGRYSIWVDRRGRMWRGMVRGVGRFFRGGGQRGSELIFRWADSYQGLRSVSGSKAYSSSPGLWRHRIAECDRSASFGVIVRRRVAQWGIGLGSARRLYEGERRLVSAQPCPTARGVDYGGNSPYPGSIRALPPAFVRAGPQCMGFRAGLVERVGASRGGRSHCGPELTTGSGRPG